MPNLEYLTSGSPSLRRKFAALVDACKKIPIPGANITADETPKGIVFNATYTAQPPQFADYTPFYIPNPTNPAVPMMGVKPGNHYDATGGRVWTPTLGGNLIAPPTTPPAKLTVDLAATVAYFKLTVNPIDGTGASPSGAITALEIDTDTGAGVPFNSNTNVFQLLAYLMVVTQGSIKKPIFFGGGVSGSQVYQCCGTSPLFGLQ